MRASSEVRFVFALREDGLNSREIAARTGIPRATIRKWLHRDRLRVVENPRFSCDGRCRDEFASGKYAYLLGQYLGDGSIFRATKGVFVLCIYCTEAYPNIIEECLRAIRATLPINPGVYRRAGMGYVEVYGYSKHWPHLFPQMGPGLKHTRPIVLETWQREIVQAHPEQLVRGLIHSDGCRAVNTIRKNGRVYGYPRYFFANESRDIIRILTDALDQLGVPWRMNRPNSVSVARRDAVAALDSLVGPKS